MELVTLQIDWIWIGQLKEKPALSRQKLTKKILSSGNKELAADMSIHTLFTMKTQPPYPYKAYSAHARLAFCH